jgi:putative hydrolase of the HAD superfamily
MTPDLTPELNEKIKERIKKLCSAKDPIQTETKAKLEKLKGIKAVYFDVYGTILISGTEPMMRKDGNRELVLLEETFKEFGLDHTQMILKRVIMLLHNLIEESHLEKKAKGVDHPEVDIINIWVKIMESLVKEGRISPFPEEGIPELLTDFVVRYDDPWLMPYTLEVIKNLQNNGAEIGIISNSQFYTPLTLEALTEESMAELGFKEKSCFWSYSEEVAKPSLEFYRRARKYITGELEIESSEVLFVGNDMLNDIYPAHKAGFKTALFAGDQRSLRLREDDQRCREVEPDIIITSLNQIEDCLA